MSYLLDTCVISELAKPEPNAGLLQWFSDRDEDTLYLSVLSMGELERGVEKLPASRRKTRLSQWVRQDLTSRFDARLLGIDLQAARRWGAIVGASDTTSRSIP